MPLLARAWIGAARARRRWGRTEPAVDPMGLLRSEARGRSVVDVGCMWGVDGAYCFAAEDAGAVSVTGVDLMPASSRFTDRARPARVQRALRARRHPRPRRGRRDRSPRRRVVRGRALPRAQPAAHARAAARAVPRAAAAPHRGAARGARRSRRLRLLSRRRRRLRASGRWRAGDRRHRAVRRARGLRQLVVGGSPRARCGRCCGRRGSRWTSCGSSRSVATAIARPA